IVCPETRLPFRTRSTRSTRRAPTAFGWAAATFPTRIPSACWGRSGYLTCASEALGANVAIRRTSNRRIFSIPFIIIAACLHSLLGWRRKNPGVVEVRCQVAHLHYLAEPLREHPDSKRLELPR